MKYHRICIREKVVSNMLKKCPDCQSDYSVGYTDCYAINNKVRPNYLAYMLVQEILFFLSIMAWSEWVRTIIIWRREWNNPFTNIQWFVIFMTLTTAATGLSIVVFLIRLKGIYLVREIEDIIIFDKS